MDARAPAHVLYHGVIVTALSRLAVAEPRLDSLAARRLLLGTAAHESGGFRHIYQAAGPARSLWQVEPATAADVGYRTVQQAGIAAALADLAWPGSAWRDQYAWNQPLACAVARLKYWFIPAAMPSADDLPGLARYWKQWFNTPLGAGQPEHWLRAWNQHCHGVC